MTAPRWCATAASSPRPWAEREPQIVTTFQVHSAEALIVKKPWPHDDRPKVDGMVTNVPGLILGTLTADCGPVLFADERAGVIGCAHAGWKGALTGITDATVLKMEELGAKRANIVAVLGPTISKAAYEVGPEFIAALRRSLGRQQNPLHRISEEGTLYV